MGRHRAGTRGDRPAARAGLGSGGRRRGPACDGAQLAELTGLLPAGTLADYPPGTRILLRRERPHPGAQLDAFEERDGWRYQCLATDTAAGQLAFLAARQRAHARVEDRIRTGKDTGLGRFPSRQFSINAAWLTTVMIAVDLIAWTQTMLLHDQPALARAEPKTLRYRMLHTAARLVRGGRRLRLRLDQHWPWAAQLAAALHPLRRATAAPTLNPAPTTRHPEQENPATQAGRPLTSPSHHRQEQDPQSCRSHS